MIDRNYTDRLRLAFAFLRVAVAGFLIAHGVARIALGIVGGFGDFLTTYNFPLGFYAAWAITIFEIVGGLVLASGRFTVVVASLFIVELIVGIALVHYKDGWFVVGAGRNGMEFSVLLIIVLAVVAFTNLSKPRWS